MNTIWMTTSSLNPSSAAKLPFLSYKSSPAPTYSKFSVTCRATNYNTENESKTNFYKVLSLSPNSNTSMDEIKRAYRSMALRYHPDVADHRDDDSSMKESTRLFVQLNEAYKTLSDPVLREEYDCELGLTANSFSCRSTTYKFRKDMNNVGPNSQWRQQILELKRRSTGRMARKEGSWASRVRKAQNVSTMEN